MEITQIKYFISVAKNLSFTKASKELFVSQAAISKQISNLENELNIQLLERNKRVVRLTEAGRVLLNEAQEIIERLDLALERTYQVNESQKGEIKIGFVGPAEAEILSELINRFHLIMPKVKVTLVQVFLENLLDLLEKNEIDLAFINSWVKSKNSNFEYKKLADDSYVIIVSKNHPLAKLKDVTLNDLKKFDFSILKKHWSLENYDKILKTLKLNDFNPKIIHEYDTIEQVLIMVNAGSSLSILPKKAFEFYNTKLLTYLNIPEIYLNFERVIMWNNTNSNPYIQLFLDQVTHHNKLSLK